MNGSLWGFLPTTATGPIICRGIELQHPKGTAPVLSKTCFAPSSDATSPARLGSCILLCIQFPPGSFALLLPATTRPAGATTALPTTKTRRKPMSIYVGGKAARGREYAAHLETRHDVYAVYDISLAS